MVVGKAQVDLNEMSRNLRSIDEYYRFCESLIPEEFRHYDKIRSNQIYLCTMLLRKNSDVSWDIKKNIIIQAMKDIKPVGFTNVVNDVSEIYNFVSMSKIRKYGGKDGRGTK